MGILVILDWRYSSVVWYLCFLILQLFSMLTLNFNHHFADQLSNPDRLIKKVEKVEKLLY
ncbi:hypothetical protein BpHYR1_016906 [Brachionus plicatilis]|uniref:Uncharacterized protein n=1 Tax=Brachionus plicatilis TaxID=10195 RepID=A0A3M7RG19_BRAPC|nr:hypothetical protein BpHYR1_016906 [Brachionus plicatilis]